LNKKIIRLYTDGSCHTQLHVGGWAAILLIDTRKIILEGTVTDTTHQRMELLAILKGLEYLKAKKIDFDTLTIYSDSQYAAALPERKEKLKNNNFLTKKETAIQNADLVQKLIQWIETYPINFVKVMAHQKRTEEINYNRDADKISRKLVREAVKKI
jgi:ribonuclease HI